jgi:hypothetical protein
LCSVTARTCREPGRTHSTTSAVILCPHLPQGVSSITVQPMQSFFVHLCHSGM